MNKYVHFKDEKGNPLAFRSHMLRDTYAVELLLAGVLLEQVSKLLTHKSTRVTEQHYAPWVRARQDQLDEVMKQASRTMGASFTGD
jgi:integrase